MNAYDQALRAFEEKLGYRFSDDARLRTALTHPSYGEDHGVAHYQRLEFLGDAVLELSVSRQLYDALPDVAEGRLTRLRAELVREETLCEAARALEIGPLLRLSPGEEKSGGRDKPSILADVVEAVLAAVYLEGGPDAASQLVFRLLGDKMDEGRLSDTLDAKTRLQELAQRDGRVPVYEQLETEGPPHDPVFTFCVRINSEAVGRGKGRSKRAAQQAAACEALKNLGR